MYYKHQVHHATTFPLRSLATHRSYCLDKGTGSCSYQVGVEDGGCHSLLDYSSIANSACVLEKKNPDDVRLVAKPGMFTRCELMIQQVKYTCLILLLL
jgi:GTPase